MAIQTQKIRGTGELLPRLKKYLWNNNVPHWGLSIKHQLTGYMNEKTVFVAKKRVWKEQVSTQKYLVQRAIERQKWIIFFIPKIGLLKFDPKTFWENSWQNKRGDEFMLNIHTKFGTWLTPDELKTLKNLEYDIETQLELAQIA